MKKGLTEIVCVIDRSGSMGMIKDSAISGFNEFIDSQRDLPGEASVTVITFSDKYEYIADNVDIKEVPHLTKDNYKTSGNTALNDTLGDAILKTSADVLKRKRKDQPEKVLFCVLSDGEENASTNFSDNSIKSLVKHKQDEFGWEFLFLCANQDVRETINKYALKVENTVCFAATADGMKDGYKNMSTLTACYRAS